MVCWPPPGLVRLRPLSGGLGQGGWSRDAAWGAHPLLAPERLQTASVPIPGPGVSTGTVESLQVRD